MSTESMDNGLFLRPFPVGVAGITGLAVVYISRDVRMSIIGVLLIMLVAEDAFERRIVVWNNVTFGAKVPSSLVSPRKNGEILGVVVPVGVPAGRIMAKGAAGRKTVQQVVRVARAVVIVNMARVAIAGGIVVSASMAGQAIQQQVSTCQWKSRGVVIERDRVPAVRGMALRAIGAEIVGHVVGVLDVVIVAFMTGETVCRRIVITVGVAKYAIQTDVRACQRKLCLAMIERNRGPSGRRMALRAIRAEVVGHVIRIIDVVVIVLVAGEAIGRDILVPPCVAGDAFQRKMRAGERELCLRMIETGWYPGGSRMAYSAVGAEIVGDMIRILDIIIVVLVAGEAVGRDVLVSACMAGDAVERDVCACQREMRLGVIEIGRGPACGRVAKSAVGVEVIIHVAGILDVVVVIFMA